MRIEHYQNLDEIRPVGEQWLQEQNGRDFGLDINMEVILEDLQNWMQADGTILMAYDGIQPVGFFAVFAMPSFLGHQRIAIEKYWFTIPGYTLAGPRLYCEAVRWAKEHGCSHLILSASNLASNMHDKVCKFLERSGAKPFETSFVLELV